MWQDYKTYNDLWISWAEPNDSMNNAVGTAAKCIFTLSPGYEPSRDFKGVWFLDQCERVRRVRISLLAAASIPEKKEHCR